MTVLIGDGLRAVNSRRRPDRVLLTAAASLSIIGLTLVWSTTRVRLEAAGDQGEYFVLRQGLFVVLGMLAAVLVGRADRRLLRSVAWPTYALSLVLLVAVLSPLGTEINGTRAWLVLPGGFTLQPAELAKISVILLAAGWLSDRAGTHSADDPPDGRSVIAVLGAYGAVAALLLLQPDLGSALVLAAAVLVMLWVSGVRWTWVAALLLAGVLAAAGAYATGLLDDYQVARFAAFLDPAGDPLGVGYNVSQALIATGSGGLLGQGLFHGGQTQGAFVPYQFTDFIFSAAGEELGLIGAATVVGLVLVVLLRGVQASAEATDLYDRVMAAGVVAWLGTQAFENIGMNLGLLPVTGVPLPFVSYGGSSTLAAWVGIGLLVHVGLHRRRP